MKGLAFAVIGLATIIAALVVQCISPLVYAQTPSTPQNSAAAPPKPGRGGLPPANLDSIVAAQSDVALVSAALLQPYMSAKAANLSKNLAKPACSAQQARFDWRSLKKVTSVKDQGTCGSCWVFAAVAAYEASYLIESGLSVLPPDNPDVSEQQALDCTPPPPPNDCDGGWHNKVFAYFVKPGETSSSEYPSYSAVKRNCTPVANHEYTAVNWNFIAGATIPDDDAIKAAICEHGPVAAGVSADGWDEFISPVNIQKPKYKYSATQNPNFPKDYPNGVFDKGFASDRSLTMATYTPSAVDHIVLIIGWDDNLHAWIIKNSWGAGWGDNGYMKLKYGTANIGFSAAWIRARARGISPNASVLRALEVVNHGFMTKFTSPAQ